MQEMSTHISNMDESTKVSEKSERDRRKNLQFANHKKRKTNEWGEVISKKFWVQNERTILKAISEFIGEFSMKFHRNLVELLNHL